MVFILFLGPPPARPTAPKPRAGSVTPSSSVDPAFLQSLNLNEYDVDPKLMPAMADPRLAALPNPKFAPPPELLDPRAFGSSQADDLPSIDPRVQALREATLAAMGGGGADYSKPKPTPRAGYGAVPGFSRFNQNNSGLIGPDGAPVASSADVPIIPNQKITSALSKPKPSGPTLADYLPYMKPKTFGGRAKPGKWLIKCFPVSMFNSLALYF